jgi:RNA polymerase-interacting CarD/CdnL/TRCF family regulator
LKLAVGDIVVVPVMGVGTVSSTEPMDVGEGPIPGYRIELGPEEGFFWIPEAQVGSQGLRPPIAAGDLDRLWEALEAQEAPDVRANWNRRRIRYNEMLACNEPLQLAALVGELSAVQAQKREKNQALSFGERQLLEQAQGLLVAEVAASTDRPREDVLKELEERLPA